MTDQDMIIACMIRAIAHADAAGLVDVCRSLSRSMARTGPMVREPEVGSDQPVSRIIQFPQRRVG